MILDPAAASTALSLVTGVVKLGGRLDVLFAEEKLAKSKLGVSMPSVAFSVTASKMLRELRAFHHLNADDLGADRAKIAALLVADDPSTQAIEFYFRLYLPHRYSVRRFDPDGDFRQALQQNRGPWNLEDDDQQLVAYYLGAGEDLRKSSFAWQLAAIVLDSFAEFAAENTLLFVRDQNTRALIQSVLERFAKHDIESISGGRELLRAIVSSVLNGVVDARDALDGDSRWIESLLDALASARDDVDADLSDDFFLGLIQGKGVHRLFGALLEEGADVLGHEVTGPLGEVLSDVIMEAGRLAKTNRSFDNYFKNSWAPLVEATIDAFATHGDKFLANDSPLLRETLLGVVRFLAEDIDGQGLRRFVKGDTFIGVVEAALSVVAENPALILDEDSASGPGEINDLLLGLISPIAGILAAKGIRSAFSNDTLKEIVQTSLAKVAEHPELLAGDDELLAKVLQGILNKLAKEDVFKLDELGSAAISGALEAIADNPALLDLPYVEVIADLSGQLGRLVGERRLSRIQAADLLGALALTIGNNPQLFADLESKLAGLIIDAVSEVTGDEAAPIQLLGAALVETIGYVLGAYAAHGWDEVEGADESLVGFKKNLIDVLRASLGQAADALGRSFSGEETTHRIGLLVAASLTGKISLEQLQTEDWETVFGELEMNIGEGETQ